MTKLLAVPRYIDTSASKRSDIGLMLRNSSVKPWKRSIAWCAVMSILPIWSGTWDHGAQAVLDRYLAFVAMVHDVGLATDIERPALLNVSAVGCFGADMILRAMRSNNCSSSSPALYCQ